MRWRKFLQRRMHMQHSPELHWIYFQIEIAARLRVCWSRFLAQESVSASNYSGKNSPQFDTHKSGEQAVSSSRLNVPEATARICAPTCFAASTSDGVSPIKQTRAASPSCDLTCSRAL